MPLAMQPAPYVPQRHDQFDVHAEGLGTYTIDVSLPANAPPGQRLPVILVVDGNLFFDAVQSVVHGGMARAGGSLLPPSIVVGVGYPEREGFASFYGRRNFDFFEAWDMTDPLGRQLHAVHAMLKHAEGKPELEIRAGGYPRFMRFLAEALLPGLAQHYPIDLAARHTLVGDSSGGHFALRAIFDPASPFSRYVAISPSLGAAPGTVQAAEAAYAAAHADLTVDVFACAGTVEVDESVPNALCRFGSAPIWLAEQFAIRGWPSARLQWELMNLENHASIAPRAIAAGLRSVHRLRPGVHVEELRSAAPSIPQEVDAGHANGVG